MKKLTTNLRLSGLLSLFVMLLTSFSLSAEPPTWTWAMQGGGVNFNSGREIVTDQQGNIYVTGFFQGTGTFGSHTITSAGGFDAFVAKFDPQGNALWANSLGGIFGDYGISIQIDNTGSVYITGYFSDVLVTPVGTFTSMGLRDIYVAKYSSEGNLLWVRHAGSPGMNEGNGLAVDNLNGQIYVTGKFEGTLLFVDTPQTLTSAGGQDIFIAAYSFDGALIWAKRAGSPLLDIGFALGVDAQGYLYGTGLFSGTADFGNFALTSNGLQDIVVFKLDSSGNWIWAKSYGGAGSEPGWDIAVDAAGNNWITGVFSSPSITFGNYTVTNTSIMQDVFVFKQNANGDVLWANSGGGVANDYGRGITVDGQGNCYIIGDYEQTATFGSHQLASVHNVDVFVVKYSPEGEALWAKSAGGQSTDSGNAIAADNSGNLFATGYFYNDMIFDDITLVASVSQPVFIAKLGSSVFAGDANCDGIVNVMDIIAIANYIMGAYPEPFCFENADVNGDNVIDVMDIIGTANIIMGSF